MTTRPFVMPSLGLFDAISRPAPDFGASHPSAPSVPAFPAFSTAALPVKAPVLRGFMLEKEAPPGACDRQPLAVLFAVGRERVGTPHLVSELISETDRELHHGDEVINIEGGFINTTFGFAGLMVVLSDRDGDAVRLQEFADEFARRLEAQSFDSELFPEDQLFRLVVTCPHRPGMMRRVTGLLAEHRINIKRMQGESGDVPGSTPDQPLARLELEVTLSDAQARQIDTLIEAFGPEFKVAAADSTGKFRVGRAADHYEFPPAGGAFPAF